MSAVGQANAFLGNVAKLGFVGVTGVAVWLGWRLTAGEEERARETSEQRAEITRLTGALGERDQSISALRSDVAERDGTIAGLRDEVAKRDRTIAEQAEELAAKQKEIERLGLAIQLLKVERRVARLVVLDQAPGPDGRTRTRVRFEEVGEDGRALGGATEATIEGDVLYVDAWVVKFEDFLVEGGDALRGASLVLFRRLFGEHQAPVDGVAIDRGGERPRAYGGDAPMSELERALWRDFWEFASDPRRAAAAGVRAAHGEAPSMKLRAGEVYTLTLRASGGLTITTERPQG